jgi:hypothetical protein
MANAEQANKARREHGNTLIRQGAHAIGVQEGKDFGKKGFVVVAHVPPDKKAKFPRSVACSTASGKVEVPVVVVRSNPFVPE